MSLTRRAQLLTSIPVGFISFVDRFVSEHGEHSLVIIIIITITGDLT